MRLAQDDCLRSPRMGLRPRDQRRVLAPVRTTRASTDVSRLSRWAFRSQNCDRRSLGHFCTGWRVHLGDLDAGMRLESSRIAALTLGQSRYVDYESLIFQLAIALTRSRPTTSGTPIVFSARPPGDSVCEGESACERPPGPFVHADPRSMIVSKANRVLLTFVSTQAGSSEFPST